MLKYIFAAIFIALAWAVVLVFHTVVPMWPAIVATAVIGGGLLLYARLQGDRRQAAAAGHREAACASRPRRTPAASDPTCAPRSPRWRRSSSGRSRR